MVAVVCALLAAGGCRKRREFRDAPLPPPPGAERGAFELTYYWDGEGDAAVGVKNDPLVPFVSVAVDPEVIPLGTRLYVKELDGAPLPSGGHHDGCVVAQDVGSKIKGRDIDWYVALKASYQYLDKLLQLTHVTVHDGGARCP